MSQESFDRFRELVLENPALQETLRGAPDQETFLTLVLQLGREQGYQFSAETVLAALAANRRAWLERWLC